MKAIVREMSVRSGCRLQQLQDKCYSYCVTQTHNEAVWYGVKGLICLVKLTSSVLMF